MGGNIAVGILVGLATGTSLYVWNSDNFTKPQKIGLVCCIIFPPMQWVLILLVLAYNKYQSENTTEAKIIKQNVESKQNLDLAKNNLIELKEKGIITEEEFNSKVEKIESQKTEFDIKNSTEYKQLKNLLDSGILTKEEFERKIKIIGVTVNGIDIKEVNNIEESTNKTYLNNLEDGVVNNKKEKLWYYIFPIAFILIFLFGIISYSEYNSDYKKSIEKTPTPVIDSFAPIKSSQKLNYVEPIKNKKFVYVLVKTEKPILTGYKSEGYGFKSYCSVKFEKQDLYSDIIEIVDYNNDVKYKLIDESESKILNNNLFISNSLYTDAIIKYGYEAAENLKDNSYEINIIESQVFTFDSYSEASKSKRNN